MNIVNGKSRFKFLFKISFCISILMLVLLVNGTSPFAVLASTEDLEKRNNESEFCYLSDIPYVAKQSSSAWKSICLDKTIDGALISVKVEGAAYKFEKGIWAHATSTVVYDLSDYQGYDYFTAYVGLNTTAASSSNGVKFYIYTSQDGKNWDLKTEANPTVMKAGQNAEFVKIDIKNAKFLKLYANDNGNNGNDHAVYADPKLIKETYTEPGTELVPSIEEIDNEIKTKFANADLSTNKEYEYALLKRELISKAGPYALRRFCSESEENIKTLEWLMGDFDTLHLYVLGGTPDGGSYYNSLTQLSRLYTKYKEDFKDTTPTNNTWYPELTKGDVYKKMAISLSLTHSTAVGYWAQINHPSNRSDALERYRIYKYLYDNGKFVVSSRQDHTPWFEALQVEEMRYVMNNITDDEELIWLNEYTQKRIDAHPNQEEKYLQPHTYIAYVWPNFQNPIFHDPARKDYWDEKFEGIFSKYGVTYSSEGDMVYKAWMSMRNEFGTGAVCGGISKLGTHIRAAHGTPASVISQPGHAAIIYYRKNAQGKGYWTIDNDVSGWAKSGKTEKLSVRMPLGWGNDRYVSGYPATYIVLAQEALNDNENYEKSEKLIMLANVYNNNLAKKEEILREALKVQNINIDAWWGLIQLYNSDPTKTQEDYYNLAKELGEALMPFPLPMNNLLNQIKPKMTDIEYDFKFTLLQTRLLTEGKGYTATDRVLQPGITRTVASYLLGELDTSLAKFSFDGEDAEKIVLSSRFDGNGIRWDYSLDGKQTWKEVSFNGDEEHKLKLTKEEIASITAENDIYVHIVGVNYSEENLYKIDILESAGLPSTLYANDLENKIMATVPVMQWKLNEGDEWTYYKDAVPDLTGNKTVTVKMGATGVYLAGKNTKTYEFTEDAVLPERKYISIDHLSVSAVSSEATSQGRHAKNIIDGNIYTSWHSAWNGTDKQKYIVIELDEPKNITALEYFPLAGGNGKIVSAQILVSMDGESWREVVSGTNWTYANANDTSMKSVDFDAAKAKYIKIVGKNTQAASAGNSFIAGAMFNLYEDTTIKIVAQFSFDGENGKKIVLDEEYKDLKWQYTLDSGKTWKNGNGSEQILTVEELNQINEEDQIKIRFEGNKKEYNINIKKGTPPVLNPYLNDLENRLIGLTNTEILEWKLADSKTWKDYSEEEPVVAGDKTLLVRAKATSIYTASDAIEYQFTADTDTETEKYIPIKHLSIEGFSTQSVDSGRPFYAPNAIDGNKNTLWHTDFRYSVIQQGIKPYIIIKLDEARYLSALEFVQIKYKVNDPDFIKNGIAYVSEDGENWVEAGRIENCPKDTEWRKIVFDESVYGQYVKLEMETYDIFASLAMVNLYEDLTKKEETVNPTAEIEYSTKELTNKDVTVKLVNPSTEITITNNEGKDTYTFTENGEFVFEFVNSKGTKGTARARVSWIDKEAPIGTVKYDVTELTGNDVVATLETNEDVTITNNDGKNTYRFTKNGEFEFIFKDKAGNEGRATAKVNWIDKELPKVTIEYDIKELTNKDVTATLVSDKEITITNNEGKDTYTFTENDEFVFEYVTKTGKTGETVAKVDWIDKEAPTGTVEYDINALTNRNVVATLFTDEDVIVTNNNGKDTYTFTENGEFEFIFKDKAGNESRVTAKVNWIDKKAPIGSVVYDITELTNKDVTATLTTSEDVIVVNNNGKATYTFTENGEFEFVFRDEAGNESKVIAKVDWIDKEAPEATVNYDIVDLTNKDVIATIECDEEITIVNNNGENSYTFTKNGEFEFIYTDELGNEGRVTAKVDWIDKEAPVGTVKYDITELTGNDVVATLEANEEIIVENNGGKTTYTFKENGEFEFVFKDKAGNEGKAVAKVEWIDKELPKITVTYDIENLTNKDVTAKIVSDKEITITNNEGKDTYTFKENGEFVFEYVTKAGKTGEVTVKVDWIDKDAPIARVSYDVTDKTTGKVVATLEANEEIIVTNNEGKTTYTFTENGEFEFVFKDKAGNEGKVVAKVDWIIKEETKPTPTPSETTKPEPTPSETTKPEPTPSETTRPEPTPSETTKPQPTPSSKPSTTPSNSSEPTQTVRPTPSTKPSQNTNSNTTNNRKPNTTSGNNSNATKDEEKITTETQTRTTTSNNELPYTGYENIGVAFRRMFLTIAIIALLAIAIYSYFNMKK